MRAHARCRTLLLSFLLFPPLLATAQTVIGVWESIPVTDANKNFKVVAKPHFIFTNAKLSAPTTFTALRDDGSSLSVLCCMVVKNITPVTLANAIKKYAVDDSFADQMKSVKGAAFIYEAVPIEPSAWSRDFKVIMANDRNPEDGSPYSAAVVGVRLSDDKDRKHLFKAGADDVAVAVTYPRDKNTIRYEFKVNGKRTIMTEMSQPHD